MDSYSNQSVSVLDRWTTSSNSTTMPRAAYGDPAGNTVFSDRWIEDGSYGICESCNEEISEKRLKARPVTTLCIACKKKQEDEERMKGL